MKTHIRSAIAFLLLATTVETFSLVMFASNAKAEVVQAQALLTVDNSQLKTNTARLSQTLRISQAATPITEPATTPTNTEATPTTVPQTSATPEATPVVETPVTPEATPAPVTPEATTPNASENAEAVKPLAPTEVRILTPAANTVLDAPATTVTLQYAAGSEVELLVGGVKVDPSLIGRTETDSKTNVVTQTWYGVSLGQGENTITAKVTAQGVVGEPTSVKVQVRGVPTQLTVKAVETRVPADGRSTVTIEGQLVDQKGNRSNRDAVITLVATAGEFIGADADIDRDGFQVKARQGQFTAQLRSTTNAQIVRILAKSLDLEAFTQVQFETNLRPSIVTGVIALRFGGRGSNYYSSFRDFLPPDGDNSAN